MMYNYHVLMILSEIATTGKESLVFIVVIIAAVLLGLSVGLFFLFDHLQRRYGEKIHSKSNTIRIFVLDVKNDKVSYFNSSKLRGRKTSSITTFYNQFSSKDRENLIAWVGDLLEDADDVKNFLEVSTFIKNRNKSYGSILQVQKIDYEKQLIYLESTLLNFSAKKPKETDSPGFISKDLFSRSIHLHNAVGNSYCLNFFNKSTKTDGINHLAFIQIKNILLEFLTENVVMTEYDFSKILISNFNITDKIKVMNYIENIVNKINSYLVIRSFSEEIGVSIGSVENQYFHRDSKALMRTAANLADLAKDTNKSILFFDESASNITNDATFRTEVETIIEKGKLRYLYQPIFDLSRNRVFAYMSKAEPVDSVFPNIRELKNFAIRTDDNQKLFSTLVTHTIANFVQERGYIGLKLFVPLTLNEVQYANNLLGHIELIREANIVLVIDEKEIVKVSDNEETMDNIIEAIHGFKSKGYEVALEVENAVLTLSPHVYALFDYFILSFTSDIESNQIVQIPVFKDMIEKLLKYQKHIIAVNIPGWDTVELFYKFGINLLSSDLIAKYNENIMPIDKKIITRIKKFED